MSDYEVNLINDNMQEFYVRFYGPTESMRLAIVALFYRDLIVPYLLPITSTLCWRCMENPCRAPRSVPIQVAQHWIYEQDIPSKYR